jgi:hypothetical protein
MPHKRWANVVRTTVRLAALGALVALALVPDRFFPGGQGIDVEGALAGDPVEIQWAGEAAAPYALVVTMETGLCDIIELDSGGAVAEHWSAQKITYGGEIQPGNTVRLIAQPGAKGHYYVRMGALATWRPAITAMRAALLGSSAVLVGIWLFRVRVNPRQWDARRRRAVMVVAATTAFTGIVLYSIIHEAGHLLFGWFWGGTPALKRVSWTIFSGEEPHADFRSLPPEAVPWMGAGGLLLPTLAGCVFVVAGFCLRGRIAGWMPLALVTAGAAMLLGNLGLFASTDHTLPLALHLGFDGVLAQIVALMPAVLTLAVYGYVAYRLRVRSEARGTR